MCAPSGHEQAYQVDIQEPGGLSRGLADGGFAGRLREVLQGAAKAPAACRQNLVGQCPGGVLARAEQQIQGGAG